MADDFELTQPVGIDAQAWHAITAHRDRLKVGPLIFGPSTTLIDDILSGREPRDLEGQRWYLQARSQ